MPTIQRGDEPIAQSKDCTLVQLAVAWVVAQQRVPRRGRHCRRVRRHSL
jgi:hypothetical protein